MVTMRDLANSRIVDTATFFAKPGPVQSVRVDESGGMI